MISDTSSKEWPGQKTFSGCFLTIGKAVPASMESSCWASPLDGDGVTFEPRRVSCEVRCGQPHFIGSAL